MHHAVERVQHALEKERASVALQLMKDDTALNSMLAGLVNSIAYTTQPQMPTCCKGIWGRE